MAWLFCNTLMEKEEFSFAKCLGTEKLNKQFLEKMGQIKEHLTRSISLEHGHLFDIIAMKEE